MKQAIFIVLSLLFIFTPYLRGLYFESDFYFIEITILVLVLFFVAYLVKSKDTSWKEPVWLILLLPLCFVISLPFAETPKGAIESILRWVTYSSFFMLLYWSSSHKKVQALLPIVFQITGIGLSFSMLLFYYKLIGFDSYLVADRFGGVFQYPNTFGMMMGVFLLFSLVMMTKAEHKIRQLVLYSFPIVAFTTNIVMSFSKGVLLILPIMWIIGLALLDVKKQLHYFVLTILLIPLTIISVLTLNEENKWSLLLFIVSCGFYSVMTYLVNKVMNAPRLSNLLNQMVPRKFSSLVIPGVIFICGVLLCLDLLHQGAITRLLPETIQTQASSISLESGTAKERLILASDSLTIIKDASMLGHGGDAWKAIYVTYQSLPYQTNKNHNGYLDWAISNGWIGLSIFLFVWGYFYYVLMKQMNKSADNTIHKAAFVASLLFFAHSFIDFNFSYGTVWFIILYLFVMGIAPIDSKALPVKNKTKSQLEKRLLPNFILLIVACSILFSAVTSYRFMKGNSYYEMAKTVTDLAVKEELIEKSIQYNPYDTNVLNVLGEIHAYKVYSLKQEDQQEAVAKVINRINKLEPHNPMIMLRSGVLLEKIGNHSEAIDYYDKALTFDRFNTKVYENSIKLKLVLYQKTKDMQEKEQLLNSAVKDYQNNMKWLEYYESTKPENSNAEFNSRSFQISFLTRYNAALAYFLNKDYLQSIYNLKNAEVENEQDLAKSLALQYVSYERAGKQNIAKMVIEEYQGNQQYLKEQINLYQKIY